jgi:hypothetical protein
MLRETTEEKSLLGGKFCHVGKDEFLKRKQESLTIDIEVPETK